LLIPSYFQQLLHQTPLQSGAHLFPRAVGAILTMPIAGRLVDKRGPGWVVLAGITLIAIGMGTFAYGVSHHCAYAPVLLIGLAVTGVGQGSTLMPLFGCAARGLAPHQVARGSTLINVNLQIGGSIGTALMSVILTSQFNHSPFIQAAGKAAALKQEATKHGPPPHPSQALAPGFMDHVTSDLSHAYTVVFVVALGFALMALIPAAFLPKKHAAEIVAGEVEGEVTQGFSGGGVDDSDVEVLDQDQDAGSTVDAADADVVQASVDAQGD
jgi:MFS family permease